MAKKPTTLGEKMKALRESQGLSVYALAKKAGVAAPVIARVESGVRSLRWETVVKLAAALGVSTEEFR